MLTGSQVLSTFGSIKTIHFIVPVTNINNVN